MNTPRNEAAFLQETTTSSLSSKLNSSPSPQFIDELAALDKDEQNDCITAMRSGQASETAYQVVREKYHGRFLDIVKRHNEAPVFRIQFPAPFLG